jgi:hypothetical protein
MGVVRAVVVLVRRNYIFNIIHIIIFFYYSSDECTSRPGLVLERFFVAGGEVVAVTTSTNRALAGRGMDLGQISVAIDQETGPAGMRYQAARGSGTALSRLIRNQPMHSTEHRERTFHKSIKACAAWLGCKLPAICPVGIRGGLLLFSSSRYEYLDSVSIFLLFSG